MENFTKNEFDDLVDKTYADFEKDFNAENFPSVFSWINEFNDCRAYESSGGHPLLLKATPIFQTPVTIKPKLMLVGNNNTWFDQRSPKVAQNVLSQMVGRPPQINSYTHHDNGYALKMRKIFGPDRGGFEGLGRPDLLASCVGLNRLWMQLGPQDKPVGMSQGFESASKRDFSLLLGGSFKDYCETRTRALIEAIQPEILVLLGKPAQRLYTNRLIPNGIQLVNSDHPSNRNGGAIKVADAIRPFV